MSRHDLLRQLAAALSAAGLLGAPAAAQAEPPEPPRAVKQSLYAVAAAPHPVPRPAHQALYAVAWREARQRRAKEARQLEEAADALLRYADTEAGQADLQQDSRLAALIEELRVIKRDAQRERTERLRQREELLAPQPLYGVAE